MTELIETSDERAITDGEHAQRLRDDPCFKQTMARLLATYFADFRECDNDPAKLAQIKAKCDVVADIDRAMGVLIDAGVRAKAIRDRFVGRKPVLNSSAR